VAVYDVCVCELTAAESFAMTREVTRDALVVSNLTVITTTGCKQEIGFEL